MIGVILTTFVCSSAFILVSCANDMTVALSGSEVTPERAAHCAVVTVFATGARRDRAGSTHARTVRRTRPVSNDHVETGVKELGTPVW